MVNDNKITTPSAKMSDWCHICSFYPIFKAVPIKKISFQKIITLKIG